MIRGRSYFCVPLITNWFIMANHSSTRPTTQPPVAGASRGGRPDMPQPCPVSRIPAGASRLGAGPESQDTLRSDAVRSVIFAPSRLGHSPNRVQRHVHMTGCAVRGSSDHSCTTPNRSTVKLGGGSCDNRAGHSAKKQKRSTSVQMRSRSANARATKRIVLGARGAEFPESSPCRALN